MNPRYSYPENLRYGLAGEKWKECPFEAGVSGSITGQQMCTLETQPRGKHKRREAKNEELSENIPGLAEPEYSSTKLRI